MFDAIGLLAYAFTCTLSSSTMYPLPPRNKKHCIFQKRGKVYLSYPMSEDKTPGICVSLQIQCRTTESRGPLGGTCSGRWLFSFLLTFPIFPLPQSQSEGGNVKNIYSVHISRPGGANETLKDIFWA